MKALRWLMPGLGVKRWLGLFLIGVAFIAAGSALALQAHVLGRIETSLVTSLYFLTGRFLPPWVLGLLAAAVGAFLMYYSIRRLLGSLLTAVVPRGTRVAETVLLHKQLERGPRIVAIGGGTGLSTLLRGLKEYTSNLTAIVTVTDDGGSSGRLRDEMGVLPPGDFRNCIVALADTEPLMEKLFQYRFTSGGDLSGHSLGNLFIAALTDISGDFEEALRQASKVLAVRGRVIPSTTANVRLRARYADGTIVDGESRIPRRGEKLASIGLVPERPRPLADALRAIERADAIILGPGSLYTSIIPNLVVPGIVEAIRRSRATVIYVANVMTQPGETEGYSAADHLQAIIDHSARGLVDVVLVNTAPIKPQLLSSYRSEGAEPVLPAVRELEALGVEVVRDALVSQTAVVRHEPARLAAAVMDILAARAAHSGARASRRSFLRRHRG